MILRYPLAMICILTTAIACCGQRTVLNGRVQLIGTGVKDFSNVVVWLTPISDVSAAAPRTLQTHPRLVQKDKHFEPHLLVVPVGTAVEFPNKDPFFHNVFSLFEGKRFDLGLYEAGSTRMVRFDKPGISYIFCNIHPEMSAIVIALATPYYAISNVRGEITIRDVPAGRYALNVWSERSVAEEMNSARRELDISETDHDLGRIQLSAAHDLLIGHKNKYGKDYDDPSPTTPGYPH